MPSRSVSGRRGIGAGPEATSRQGEGVDQRLGQQGVAGVGEVHRVRADEVVGVGAEGVVGLEGAADVDEGHARQPSGELLQGVAVLLPGLEADLVAPHGLEQHVAGRAGAGGVDAAYDVLDLRDEGRGRHAGDGVVGPDHVDDAGGLHDADCVLVRVGEVGGRRRAAHGRR